MAKEAVPKFDPNTEAFQMRAQWKKVEICRKQWFERWSWLLDERRCIKYSYYKRRPFKNSKKLLPTIIR